MFILSRLPLPFQHYLSIRCYKDDLHSFKVKIISFGFIKKLFVVLRYGMTPIQRIAYKDEDVLEIYFDN